MTSAEPTKDVCRKCGLGIFISNHEFPDYGLCWHTITDDDPMCQVRTDSESVEGRYFHRPQGAS